MLLQPGASFSTGSLTYATFYLLICSNSASVLRFGSWFGLEVRGAGSGGLRRYCIICLVLIHRGNDVPRIIFPLSINTVVGGIRSHRNNGHIGRLRSE